MLFKQKTHLLHPCHSHIYSLDLLDAELRETDLLEVLVKLSLFDNFIVIVGFSLVVLHLAKMFFDEAIAETTAEVDTVIVASLVELEELEEEIVGVGFGSQEIPLEAEK